MVKKAVQELKKEKKAEFKLPEIEIEYSKNIIFGDYTTNIAMILAKSLKENPLIIAHKIIQLLGEKKFLAKVEAVAPGYINFHLAEKYLQTKLEEIYIQDKKFGDSTIGIGKKVNNEFISANPTGPLHLGNGRGGFYGDVIGRILTKAGYLVTNEYYVNDAGEQIIKLGHSVLKDQKAVYQGEYIDELHRKFSLEKEAKTIGQKSAQEILEKTIKKVVQEQMNIKIDSWVSEVAIQKEHYIEKALDIFQKKNLIYQKEGATWLRTTKFGDDKDRVLIKKNGQKTYFASDCGYLLSKKERGFDKLIEIWGADHHGYMARFQSAARALDFLGELKFIIVQLVRLVKEGKEVRMSKRAGNVVYIDELINEVGQDVTRFFFLMYSPNTHMDFDLGLAKEKSQKNPVFYVQYAHARISSILRKNKLDLQSSLGSKKVNLSLLNHPKELELMRELNKFPELIEELANNLEVHKLPYYATKLADKFHSFYAQCQVNDKDNQELSLARQKLVKAVKIVLAETLNLIGVEVPERMEKQD